MLAMFLSVDRRTAIMCHDHTKSFNSICHPAHVPSTAQEFERYFPRVYNAKGTVTVKCHITSSMAMQDIKNSIIEKLQKYNYYVRPTPLKAIRTGKVGWMYLAHPDLTHRADFQNLLGPLIKTRFGREVEFSIAPEMLTVESENNKVSYRVLIVRTAYDDLERMRIFLTEAFAYNSTMGISYLARYTFVPAFPVGGIAKKHLQNLLRMQKHFNEKVFWYNLIGVRDIDSQHALKSKQPNKIK